MPDMTLILNHHNVNDTDMRQIVLRYLNQEIKREELVSELSTRLIFAPYIPMRRVIERAYKHAGGDIGETS